MSDEAAPPQPPTAAIAELKENIAKIKQEVDDALKIASKQAEGSGLRSPTLIISLLALLFSFGTTTVSYYYYRTRQQDIHDARTELRGLIERLSQIPRENLENSKKYANEPNILGDLSSQMNAENAMIAEEAAALVERIPSHVSAPEYTGVAIALSNSGLTDRALRLIKLGLVTADNVNDEVGLLRFDAICNFQVGDFEKGREQYKKALGIFAKYTPMNSYYVETNTFSY